MGVFPPDFFLKARASKIGHLRLLHSLISLFGPLDGSYDPIPTIDVAVLSIVFLQKFHRNSAHNPHQ
jgi:hypothetical protein